MYETVEKYLAKVAGDLEMADDELDALKAMNAEHTFEVELDNGRKLQAHRFQHNNKRGPYKGGVRFHPRVDIDEVRSLATLMSLKTAAVNIPMGGAKGGVVVDPNEVTEEVLEEISRKYVRGLHEHIGPDQDIAAPDVNTNAQIIDWMVDEYEQITGNTTKASLTGKSLDNGGSEGRVSATGRGGVIVLAEVLKSLGEKYSGELTYAIQGFGNVGAFFATTAAELHPEWKLVAASDVSTTLANPDGLNVHELSEVAKRRETLDTYKDKSVKQVDRDDIVKQDVDILVLAALEDAITMDNVGDIKASVVLEMANGPINFAANQYLAVHDTPVIPDIIANAGGVTVSYLEWLQNRQHERWDETRVFSEMESHLVTAVHDMLATAKEHAVPMKEAALINAVKRLR